MLVNFDVPRKLKKGDLLIYDGKKFTTIDLKEITEKQDKLIADLLHRVKLLEQRLELNIIEEIKKVVSK